MNDRRRKCRTHQTTDGFAKLITRTPTGALPLWDAHIGIMLLFSIHSGITVSVLNGRRWERRRRRRRLVLTWLLRRSSIAADDGVSVLLQQSTFIHPSYNVPPAAAQDKLLNYQRRIWNASWYEPLLGIRGMRGGGGTRCCRHPAPISHIYHRATAELSRFHKSSKRKLKHNNQTRFAELVFWMAVRGV